MFKQISTRDVLAVMIVGAALAFNAVSLFQGKPFDAATFGMAGIIVGYYFKGNTVASVPEPQDEELAEPSLPGGDE